MKIFIYDHDQNLIQSLENILSELTDADIFTEINCTTAYERIRRVKPDILIADLGELSLYEVGLIEKVRERLLSDKLFIIGTSVSMDDKLYSFRAGADAFLCKPFDLNELLQLVDTQWDKIKLRDWRKQDA